VEHEEIEHICPRGGLDRDLDDNKEMLEICLEDVTHVTRDGRIQTLYQDISKGLF